MDLKLPYTLLVEIVAYSLQLSMCFRFSFKSLDLYPWYFLTCLFWINLKCSTNTLMFRVYFLFVTPCTFSHGIIISSFKLRKILNAFLVYLNTTFNDEDMRTIIMQNRCRLTIFNYSSSMLIEKIISFICFFESLCFVHLQNQWILK